MDTTPDLPRLAVVVGSTRPGRRSLAVAEWAAAVAARHLAGRAEVQLLDVAAHDLPLLDEPVPAMFGAYRYEHTRRWSAAVAAADAVLFVTAEHNASIPAALKNAVDYLYAEWAGKPAGVLSFGVRGGTGAAGHLRDVLTEVRMAVAVGGVALHTFEDFDFTGTDPDDPTTPGVLRAGRHEPALSALLDDLVPVRTPARA